MTVLGDLDPASDRPVFQQIADHLRAAIQRGEVAAGDRLPSESVLLEHYGVARMTIRQALGVLKAEGLVVAEHGRGVFVRSRPTVRRLGSDRFAQRHRKRGRAAFFADADAAGQRATVDQLEITRVRPPAEIAEHLGIDPRTKVLARRRRYSVEGHPVELAISYIPLNIAEGTAITELDTGPGGFYARMEDLGYTFATFHEDVSARMPSPEESSALALAPGIPVLHLCRRAIEKSGRVLSICDTVMAADSFVLSYDLPAK